VERALSALKPMKPDVSALASPTNKPVNRVGRLDEERPAAVFACASCRMQQPSYPERGVAGIEFGEQLGVRLAKATAAISRNRPHIK
jgi:hypothetical protein